MPPLIDLTGQKFGRLTVLGRHLSKHVSLVKYRGLWICRCDCGAEVITRSHSLRAGRSLSCGCLRSDRLKEHWKKRREELSNKALKEFDDIFNSTREGDSDV